MNHYLKKITKLRLLSKRAKADSLDKLTRLFMGYVHGESISDEAMISRLNEHFNHDRKVVHYDQEYKQILDIAKRVYMPAKKLPDHQLQSLTDTIYQKSLNMFHLKDYADRGTQYVQVRAILDSHTTKQCRQMNGRIFAVGTLQKEIPNQPEIVRSNEWWENADYFKQVPTRDMVPMLPPYHYNCRTRIVPYVKPDNPVDALRDKFENYDLSKRDIPGVVNLAMATKWKPGEQEKHFEKHYEHLGSLYQSPGEYQEGAIKVLTSDNKHLGLITNIQEAHLQLLVWQDIPDSKAKKFVVFDLTTGHILSYYKKGIKKITVQFDEQHAIKAMLFKPEEIVMKHVYVPETYSVEEMLAILEDMEVIINYTFIPIAIEHWDSSGLLHTEDPMDYRRDVLQPLAKLGKLTDDQLHKIDQVDKYVIAAKVPEEMQEFQTWLSVNPIK